MSLKIIPKLGTINISNGNTKVLFSNETVATSAKKPLLEDNLKGTLTNKLKELDNIFLNYRENLDLELILENNHLSLELNSKLEELFHCIQNNLSNQSSASILNQLLEQDEFQIIFLQIINYIDKNPNAKNLKTVLEDLKLNSSKNYVFREIILRISSIKLPLGFQFSRTGLLENITKRAKPKKKLNVQTESSQNLADQIVALKKEIKTKEQSLDIALQLGNDQNEITKLLEKTEQLNKELEEKQQSLRNENTVAREENIKEAKTPPKAQNFKPATGVKRSQTVYTIETRACDEQQIIKTKKEVQDLETKISTMLKQDFYNQDELNHLSQLVLEKNAYIKHLTELPMAYDIQETREHLELAKLKKESNKHLSTAIAPIAREKVQTPKSSNRINKDENLTPEAVIFQQKILTRQEYLEFKKYAEKLSQKTKELILQNKSSFQIINTLQNSLIDSSSENMTFSAYFNSSLIHSLVKNYQQI